MACRVLTHSNNRMCLMNYFPQELTKTVPEGEWLETRYPRCFTKYQSVRQTCKSVEGYGLQSKVDQIVSGSKALTFTRLAAANIAIRTY